MDRRGFLGGTAAFALACGQAMAAEGDLELKIEGGDLSAWCGGRPLLRYRGEVVKGPPGTDPLLARSGYLHPVHAPNGAVVTDDFNPDHLHQRGIWAAYTKTRVMVQGEALERNYWDLLGGGGRIRAAGVELLRGGTLGFRSRQLSEATHRDRWVPVLEEVWEVRFPPQPAGDPMAALAAYVFDITSRQTAKVPFEVLKYHYGGMAVRAARPWQQGSDVTVLTSEGKDRVAADAAPARWVDMSGTVEGRRAGVTLMDHPGNMHAPNVVRVHPTMPYYVFTLHASGPVTFQPGEEHLFRYRVVAHNGGADAGQLDRLWREFAGAGTPNKGG